MKPSRRRKKATPKKKTTPKKKATRKKKVERRKAQSKKGVAKTRAKTRRPAAKARGSARSRKTSAAAKGRAKGGPSRAPRPRAAAVIANFAGAPAPMDVGAGGLAIIKEFEGLKTELYDDPVGHCSVGYGHLVHKGNCDGKAASEQPFIHGISEADATALLRQDARTAVTAVNDLVTVPLNQNQFDALVSFVYNVGRGNFGGSTLLTKVNGKRFSEAAAEFAKWTHAGGTTLPGLVRRRKAEADLFERP